MTNKTLEIVSEQQEEIPGLDFNITASDGRKVKITLPVIGEKNVPTGVIAAIGSWQDAMDGSDKEQARVLYQLLETVRGAWPEEGRKLWSLDFKAATMVFEAWFNASVEAGFDPKA